MPIVRVEMLSGRSPELKQRLAAEMTALVARLCGSDPAHIYVMFQDFAHQDWAVAGRVFPSPLPSQGTDGEPER
jgi:4-oxalocrotonate tautomerase